MCVCVRACVCVCVNHLFAKVSFMQGAEVHHKSLQPMKTLLCMQCKRTCRPVPGC